MISLHRDTQNLGNQTRYYKDFEPVDFGDDLERLASVICRFAWSPNQWLDGGRRRQSSWTRALYCVLDFDDGVMTLDQAKMSFADCIHIIGTTRSHQRPKGDLPACDRFRVLLRFQRPIEDLKEFRASQAFWIGRFGSDESCIDGARFYWPCTSIVSIQTDGDTVEVIQPIVRKSTRNYDAYRSARVIPAHMHPTLRRGAEAGERNSTCFRLAAELTRCGFDGEQVFSIIDRSPIALSPDEKRRAVANGIKAAKAEVVAND